MTLLVAPVLLMASCSGPSAPMGFDSPLPAQRVWAIHDDQQPEPHRLARLVEQLDHHDAALRLVAINKLHGLTGMTHGYRYDALFHERQEAVNRWVEWLSSGTSAGAQDSQ